MVYTIRERRADRERAATAVTWWSYYYIVITLSYLRTHIIVYMQATVRICVCVCVCECE